MEDVRAMFRGGARRTPISHTHLVPGSQALEGSVPRSGTGDGDALGRRRPHGCPQRRVEVVAAQLGLAGATGQPNAGASQAAARCLLRQNLPGWQQRT